jgi:hypothetical protein
MGSLSLESRPIFIVLRLSYQDWVGGGFSEDIGVDFSSI